MAISCKWPLMIVRGESVTPEQAVEIIRRTDSFWGPYGGGNDRQFDGRLWKAFGFPTSRGIEIGDWNEYFERREKWKRDWGYIDTEYVHNAFISSAYIFGPSGWVWPDGVIQHDKNVGKWPSHEEVLGDWAMIAREFPFLNLDAVLFDGEDCQENVSPTDLIRVRAGTATHTDEPDEVATGFSDFGMTVYGNRDEQKTKTNEKFENELQKIIETPPEMREHFWTEEQIRELWADRLVEGE